MNGRQRVAAAMRHEEPDRVPVMCQLALGHYFLHGRRRPADIWFDSKAFAETLVDFRARYGFDGILVNLPGRPAGWREYVADRRIDGERELLRWTCGIETQVPPDDNPHARPADGGPLPRAPCEAVDPADPRTYRLAGYVWNTWHAPCGSGSGSACPAGGSSSPPPARSRRMSGPNAWSAWWSWRSGTVATGEHAGRSEGTRA